MSITQKMIDGAFARSEDRRNGLELSLIHI